MALDALKRGDCETAQRALSALIDAEPATATERAFLLNKRGVAWIGLGRRDLARLDFEATLEIDARHAAALTNLGSLSFEDGALEEAIARYEAAIAADPDYPMAHANLSAAYKRAGRYEEAVRAFRHAQRLEGRKRTRPTLPK